MSLSYQRISVKFCGMLSILLKQNNVLHWVHMLPVTAQDQEPFKTRSDPTRWAAQGVMGSFISNLTAIFIQAVQMMVSGNHLVRSNYYLSVIHSLCFNMSKSSCFLKTEGRKEEEMAASMT